VVGHVHKRVHRTKAGKESVLFYAVAPLPSLDGRRRSDWGQGYRRKADAEAALVKKLAALQTGQFVGRSDVTVSDYIGRWLAEVQHAVKPTTFKGYSQIARDYVLPWIGSARLQALDGSMLAAWLATLLREGKRGQRSAGERKRRAPGPLSEKTVANVQRMFNAALVDAVRKGLLVSNPMATTNRVKVRGRSREVNVWDESHVRAFLTQSMDNPHQAIFHVLLMTGMRRGELAGLRWQDIDFEKAVLAVRNTYVVGDAGPIMSTPKSSSGGRVIALDARTMEVLSDRREAQRAERADWGAGYRDLGLVFTREDGSPWHPDRLSEIFDQAVLRAGLPRITVHGARHTHATLLLKHGVPVKVVSERLGHADPAFTIRTYQHLLPSIQADAAARLAAVLLGGGDESSSGSEQVTSTSLRSPVASTWRQEAAPWDLPKAAEIKEGFE
jgi:integrase